MAVQRLALDWQRSRRSIADRLRTLFDRDELSDVTFFVGRWSVACSGQPRKEQLRRMPAHRFVLHTGSALFEATLAQPLAGPAEVFVLDVDASPFLAMLRYIYCEQTELTDQDAIPTLALALKYELPLLADAAVDRLCTMLTCENALEIYEQTEQFRMSRLTERLGRLVRTSTRRALRESFAKVRRSTVRWVLTQPTLRVAELLLFEWCLLWARRQCASDGIQKPTAVQLRRALGDLVYLLRIPSIASGGNAAELIDSGIFSDEEQRDLLLYALSDDEPVTDFLSKFDRRARPSTAARSCDLPKAGGQSTYSEQTAVFSETIVFEGNAELQLAGVHFASTVGLRCSYLKVSSDGGELFFAKEAPLTAHRTFSFPTPIFVEPARKYELSVQMHLEKAVKADCAQPVTQTVECKPVAGQPSVRITVSQADKFRSNPRFARLDFF